MNQRQVPEGFGATLIVLAMVLTGTAGTAQALAPSGAEPEVIGFLRLAIGGPVLLAAAVVGGKLRRMPVGPVLVAAVSFAAYQPFFFTGVDRTGVAVGTIVAIGSAPVFTGALVLFARRETIEWRWAAATALAVGGGTLLLAGGEASGVDATGVALALGAGLSYAVFAVAAKGLLDHHPPIAVMAVTLTVGAVFLLPLLAGANLAWVATAQGAAVAVHVGVVATAIAYVLFGHGIARTPVANVVTLTLAEPLTATFLGVAVLGERFTPLAALGTTLVLLGLFAARSGTPVASQRLGAARSILRRR